MAWGIELPFDRDYVCYVWFDALLNYLTAIGYRRNDEQFSRWWPVTHHLIGKDILTTHTVYWPTMLRALDLAQPQSIVAHGWWLVDQAKMSKSRGNAVDPIALAEKYGRDAFRYFLTAGMTTGQDANFSELALVERFNADLAGNLGNMLSRVVKLVHDSFGGRIPAPGALDPNDTELRDLALSAVDETARAVHEVRPDLWIRTAVSVASACNKYFEKTTPWKLAKASSEEIRRRLGTVLNTTLEALRVASGLLYPIVPTAMTEYRTILGVEAGDVVPDLSKIRDWPGLPIGGAVGKPKAVFPRLDAEALRKELG
jgi:methionyl-tRNA synthetase